MMNKKELWEKITGKGYYIALISCAIAIGISGYLYYRNVSKDAAQQEGPAVDALAQSTPTDPAQPTSDSKPPRFGMPVSGEAVREYAMDCLSYDPTTRDWRVHDGIDYAAPAGTPVTAAADGVVYTVYQDETMGTTVVLRHDGGYVTTYSSLDPKLTVEAGEEVFLGQTIGYVGTSALVETALGEHVHFCVTLGDMSIDPAHILGG